METMAISLLEFNRRVGRLLQHESVQRCWILAETSDVMVKGGHCYLELVQKNPDTGQTVAKARAIIWASRYVALRAKFEQGTGQAFGAGLNVMVEVSVNFHEQFGFSLLINNINPSYTLGDMARQRLEILNRLKREGIIDMNRALEWPSVAQRIAVISARDAAGYGDFMNQLHGNGSGLKFYTCLFSATMQGVNTVPSVIAALERINEYADLFDCVVIIRGGGSTSDLNSFDNYDLASHIAQFPLPVVSGIGHDRDNTVIDAVANVRVKTPTAAAEWLLAKAQDALDNLNRLSEGVVSSASQMLVGARQQLGYFAATIPYAAGALLTRHRSRLNALSGLVPVQAARRIEVAKSGLAVTSRAIVSAAQMTLERNRLRVEHLAKQVELLSPDRVLKRGYSLTMKDGKVVTDASTLESGDVLTTRLACGDVQSIVKS